MIITVGGSIGSGKSTLARRLAEHYKLPYYSVGGIMRDLAKAKGISILEISALAESDPSIDKELDKKQKELVAVAKKKGGCVMDSRLGAHLLDADFRIWLDASPDVKATRISGRDTVSLNDAKKNVKAREASEAKRYKEIYNINIKDMSIYNIIINTDEMSPEEVASKCVSAITARGL